MKTAIRVLALAVGCALASACQQGADSAAAPKQAAAAPLQIAAIHVGPGAKDAPPAPQTAQQPVRVQIDTRGSSAGAQLQVKLIELKSGRQVGLVERRIVAAGPLATQLKLDPPSTRWNPGRYLIEISLDGKLAEQRDFDIFEAAAK